MDSYLKGLCVRALLGKLDHLDVQAAQAAKDSQRYARFNLITLIAGARTARSANLVCATEDGRYAVAEVLQLEA